MKLFRPAVFGAALFTLLATPVKAAEEGAVLWEQDYSHLEPGPAPDFGKGLEIREENGMKFLSKLDSETQFLGTKESRGPATAAWIDYVYSVRFREPEKFTTTLLVKGTGERPEVPYLWYYVAVSSKGIGILCHGLPKDDQYKDDPRRTAEVTFESMGASPLSLGEWVTVKVAVGNDVIKVKVEAEDQIPRAAEFKVFPGTGGVGIGARGPVDVLSANVREAGEPVVAKP